MNYNVNDIGAAIQDLYQALANGFDGDLFNAELGRQRRMENYTFSVEPVEINLIELL